MLSIFFMFQYLTINISQIADLIHFDVKTNLRLLSLIVFEIFTFKHDLRLSRVKSLNVGQPTFFKKYISLESI